MSSFDEILKEEFISRILLEESRNIDQAQMKEMVQSGFRSRQLLNQRHFSLSQKTNLQYTHLKRHRFVDMSFRNTKKGRIKKISHPIHNKILFGHANNIVRRLSFEFTSETKAMLLKDLPTNL